MVRKERSLVYFSFGFVLRCLSMCLAHSAFAADVASTKIPSLASYDWSVTASKSMVHHPPSHETVESFLRELEISANGDSELGDNEAMCSFKFANLRRDGFLSLVIGVGVSNSPYPCRNVYIIDKRRSGFEIYLSGGAAGAGADVQSDLVDLRRDGTLQFLLRTELGSITGGCGAVRTSIFAWTGNGYTNVSEQFKDYYRKRLATLDRKISADKPDEPFSEKPICAQAEAAAIERYLDISQEAGLDQAIQLAGMKEWNDWPIRLFAVQLLREINTPKARKCLQMLTNDAYPTVALFAKKALSRPPLTMMGAPDSFQRIQKQ